MTLVGFVRKNLFRNKRRSILTLLSISFSFLVLTLMASVWRTFYIDVGSEDSAERIIVGHAVERRTLLPGSYREAIRALPGVRQVVNLTFFGGQYKDNRPENEFVQFGTDPEEVFKVYRNLHIPPDQLAEWKRDRSGCVVDDELAQRYGWKIGDRMFLKGGRVPVDLELTVRGIFHSTSPGGADQIFFNQAYLDEAFPKIKGSSGFYVVLADSAHTVAGLTSAIDDKFRNSEHPTQSWSEDAFALAFISTLGNIKAYILSIASAVVFATLLVSATTMAMSIRERTREAAVLKTLGFTQSRIMGLFMFESVGLALTGACLGVLAAAWLVPAIARSPQAGVFLNEMAIRSSTVVGIFLISAIAGVLTSVVPAYRASHEPIAGGLRHIG